MRSCDRCGSKLDEDSGRCPICDSMSESEREKYKLSSKIFYVFVLAVTIFHAFYYIISCSKEIINIFTLGEDYRPPSIFIEFIHNKLTLNIITVIFMYGILPFAFMLFNIIIIARNRSVFLIIFPICGIASEIAQLAQQCDNYDLVVREKMSYLYALIGIDILSAVLIIAFFVIMARFILRGYSISQSRWLIVAGFVFVFARVILKVSFYDEGGLIPRFNEMKGYLLFSAALLNVKKRLITSKTL